MDRLASGCRFVPLWSRHGRSARRSDRRRRAKSLVNRASSHRRARHRLGGNGHELRPLMLTPLALTLDIGGAIDHFRERGWARLGVVASEPTLAKLRSRADDIMLGRAACAGLFFPRDGDAGRYEDLAFGRGWEGPSLEYRKIEK